jgi:transposase
MNTVKFIGMDVHKKSITIAIADQGRRGPARGYGAITNDLGRLGQVLS